MDLSPLRTLMIFALFFVLGVSAFAFYDASIKVPRFRYMQTDDNGKLYIHLAGSLYQYDLEHQFERKIDLDQHQSTSALSNFDFFNNGDLLIREGVDPTSILDKVSIYLGFQNPAKNDSLDGQGILMRCQMQLLQCNKFGSSDLAFDVPLYLTIDRQMDRVFVADSTNHKIKLLDQDGQELSQIEDKLNYPHQLIVSSQLLYVANTNRREISVYKIENQHLSKEHDLSFKSKSKKLSKHRWPVGMALLENSIWLVKANDDTDETEIIVFNEENRPIAKLDTPAGANIYSLVKFGNEILANDFDSQQIYRFDLTGKRLENFFLGPLDTSIQRFNDDREKFDLAMWIFIILFSVAFCILSSCWYSAKFVFDAENIDQYSSVSSDQC